MGRLEDIRNRKIVNRLDEYIRQLDTTIEYVEFNNDKAVTESSLNWMKEVSDDLTELSIVKWE